MYILELESLEEQNKSMCHRGRCDRNFPAKMALQICHEHGLGTLTVFIELVKAFYSVSHGSLSVVVDKIGIPCKMKMLIMNRHSELVIGWTV